MKGVAARKKTGERVAGKEAGKKRNMRQLYSLTQSNEVGMGRGRGGGGLGVGKERTGLDQQYRERLTKK